MAREHVISTLTAAGFVAVLGTAGLVVGFGSQVSETTPQRSSQSDSAVDEQRRTDPPGAEAALADPARAAHPGGAESPVLARVRQPRSADAHATEATPAPTTGKTRGDGRRAGEASGHAAVAQRPADGGGSGRRRAVERRPATSAAIRAVYQARLASDGLLPGRFQFREALSGRAVPAERITVTFLRQGQVVSRVEPGIGGVFQAAGLEPGTYSVVASGPDGFAAFGLQVLPESAEAAAGDSLQVQARLLPPATSAVLRQLVPRYVSKFDGNAAADGGRFASGVSRTRDTVPVAVNSAPRNGGHGGAANGFVLPIRDDGAVFGRLVHPGPSAGRATPVAELTVFLAQGNRILARTRTGANGRFYFTAVEPGHYSLLALGPKALVAVGVQAVPHETVAANHSNENDRRDQLRLHRVAYLQEGESETTLQDGPPSELGIAVVQQEDLPPALDEMPPGEEDEEPLPPFGGGPGGPAGGGGNGGGGALLAAMSGTALGLGIAALADDDEDDDEERPVSPFRPDDDDNGDDNDDEDDGED